MFRPSPVHCCSQVRLQMFIHFGTKIVYTELGRVASYCLICHSRQPFKVVRIAEHWHIYEIPISSYKLLGHERICENCNQTYPTNPLNYRTILKNTQADLEELIQMTRPDLEAGLYTELQLCNEIMLNDSAKDDRERLISAPFHLLYPSYKASQIHRRNLFYLDGVGCGIVFSLVITMAILGAVFSTKPEFIWILLANFILHMVVFVIAAVTADKRFTMHKINPKLVRALTPLDVKEEELEDLIRRDPIAEQLSRWMPPHQLYQLLISQTQDQSPLGKI